MVFHPFWCPALTFVFGTFCQPFALFGFLGFLGFPSSWLSMPCHAASCLVGVLCTLPSSCATRFPFCVTPLCCTLVLRRLALSPALTGVVGDVFSVLCFSRDFGLPSSPRQPARCAAPRCALARGAAPFCVGWLPNLLYVVLFELLGFPARYAAPGCALARGAAPFCVGWLPTRLWILALSDPFQVLSFFLSFTVSSGLCLPSFPS